MNSITNGRFMTILNSNKPIDVADLEAAYNELASQLADAVDNISNLLPLCRLLNSLSIDLEAIIEKWRYKKSRELTLVLKKALKLVQSEKELL